MENLKIQPFNQTLIEEGGGPTGFVLLFLSSSCELSFEMPMTASDMTPPAEPEKENYT